MAEKFLDRFPKIQYNNRTLTDITRHIRIPDIISKYGVFYEKYQIREGENIEDIAFKYYGDPGYWWIVLISNVIINPYYDWPLSFDQVTNRVNDLYDNDPYGVHHYEANEFSTLPPGTIVDSLYSNKMAVTNYEYEIIQNEAKRNIKLVRVEFLNRINDEFVRKIAT